MVAFPVGVDRLVRQFAFLLADGRRELVDELKTVLEHEQAGCAPLTATGVPVGERTLGVWSDERGEANVPCAPVVLGVGDALSAVDVFQLDTDLPALRVEDTCPVLDGGVCPAWRVGFSVRVHARACLLDLRDVLADELVRHVVLGGADHVAVVVDGPVMPRGRVAAPVV